MYNRITVFTPTYNRGYIIKELYDSLVQQTFKDFEWVVVDDGSQDNTKELIQGFIKEKLINITYYKQDNGGKHRAINKGLDLAKGELFFIVDSDDKLTRNALEIIYSNWEPIDNKEEFCGISGLRGYTDTEIIGNSHKSYILDCNVLEYRYRYNIIGDKAEAWKTSVLKANKFPEFKGENFIAESVVWNKIGSNLKVRWISEVIYVGNYLEDGLSNKITKIRIENIEGTLLVYKNNLEYDIPYAFKVKNYINYYRFLYHSKVRKKGKFIYSISVGNIIGIIAGVLVYINDLIKLQNQKKI